MSILWIISMGPEIARLRYINVSLSFSLARSFYLSLARSVSLCMQHFPPSNVVVMWPDVRLLGAGLHRCVPINVINLPACSICVIWKTFKPAACAIKERKKVVPATVHISRLIGCACARVRVRQGGRFTHRRTPFSYSLCCFHLGNVLSRRRHVSG